MKVCYFGTFRAEYSRNQIMIEGLRRAGAQVVECHVPLWRGIQDRVEAASGQWLRPAFLLRALKTYLELLRRYRLVGDYDVLIVGYPGQFDVYLARLLSWLKHKPLVWDVFMSIYLISLERGLDRRSGPTVWAIRQIERLACRLPDMLILDTAEYVEWFRATHGINPSRFRLVPTGADARIFKPLPRQQANDGLFRVMHYSTFIAGHGIEHIIEAARLLRDEQDIHFELIGRGPEKERAVALAQQYALTNVTFVDWLEQAELVERAARADVCLGIFGVKLQAIMTIQNKIYEGLAMACPVITADAPAIRRALTHGEHIFLCRRADPDDLAQAIRTLRDDSALRERLARSGYQRFQAKFSLEAIGQCFMAHLLEVVGSTNGSRQTTNDVQNA